MGELVPFNDEAKLKILKAVAICEGDMALAAQLLGMEEADVLDTVVEGTTLEEMVKNVIMLRDLRTYALARDVLEAKLDELEAPSASKLFQELMKARMETGPQTATQINNFNGAYDVDEALARLQRRAGAE